MADEHDEQPIIVIKRIIKKGGHHGGAWKLAYADFVTAMMAFFLMLWLMGLLNETQRKNISDYFKRPMRATYVDNQPNDTNIPKYFEKQTLKSQIVPIRFEPTNAPHDNAGIDDQPISITTQASESTDIGTGKKKAKDGKIKQNPQSSAAQFNSDTPGPRSLENIDQAIHSQGATGQDDTNDGSKAQDNNIGQGQEQNKHRVTDQNEQELKELAELGEALNDEFGADGDLSRYKEILNFEMIDDGLKIQIKSLQNRPMFSSGQTDFELYARKIMKWLTRRVASSKRRVTIIGHTDAQPYINPGLYSNWELSSDRANAVRRYLIHYGLKRDSIIRVQGAGSTNLLDKYTPENPRNRRIDIILLTKDAAKRLLEQ